MITSISSYTVYLPSSPNIWSSTHTDGERVGNVRRLRKFGHPFPRLISRKCAEYFESNSKDPLFQLKHSLERGAVVVVYDPRHDLHRTFERALGAPMKRPCEHPLKDHFHPSHLTLWTPWKNILHFEETNLVNIIRYRLIGLNILCEILYYRTFCVNEWFFTRFGCKGPSKNDAKRRGKGVRDLWRCMTREGGRGERWRPECHIQMVIIANAENGVNADWMNEEDLDLIGITISRDIIYRLDFKQLKWTRWKLMLRLHLNFGGDFPEYWALNFFTRWRVPCSSYLDYFIEGAFCSIVG